MSLGCEHRKIWSSPCVWGLPAPSFREVVRCSCCYSKSFLRCVWIQILLPLKVNFVILKGKCRKTKWRAGEELTSSIHHLPPSHAHPFSIAPETDPGSLKEQRLHQPLMCSVGLEAALWGRPGGITFFSSESSFSSYFEYLGTLISPGHFVTHLSF